MDNSDANPLLFIVWFFGPILVCILCTEIKKWIKNYDEKHKND